MLIAFQKGKRNYLGSLADDAHRSIKNLKEFKGRYSQYTMGLHLNNESIGQGSLMRWRGARTRLYLQTENTQLYRGYRNKGHGIILYIFLIEMARMLGAKRIYSSRTLNSHSRRMWAEKLPQLYTVTKIPGFCRCCHRRFSHGQKPTFLSNYRKNDETTKINFGQLRRLASALCRWKTSIPTP